MRALTVVEPHLVEIQQRPDLTAAPGEVLIEPQLVGICGTDLDIIDGTIDPAFISYPIVIGHEWAGTVVASTTGDLTAGTRVVVEGVIPCGHCDSCLIGATNRCDTYDEFGFTRDGAAADLFVTPATQVHALADSVTWESAALVEPAAVVYRALANAAPSPGARVLVIGDGTVGLLAATLVRLFEPAKVTILGARPIQQRLATLSGADSFTTDAGTLANDFDLVIEAAGAVEATSSALRLAARGAKIVLLGYPGQGQTVALHVDDVVNNDLTIMGSFSYTSQAWAKVVSLLNDGRFDLTWLVTHRFTLDDFAAGTDALRHATGERGKVLLEVAGARRP
jgi:2-desacetyl-2-hydroxyethyl bacteriochlorophyllide A dehydrogenase